VLTRGRRAGNTYPRIDPSAGDPGFCYDTGLLLPAFNPLAVELPAGQLPAGGVLAASPLSTLLVFGQPIGALPCHGHNSLVYQTWYYHPALKGMQGAWRLKVLSAGHAADASGVVVRPGRTMLFLLAPLSK